jgi:hypothetical protein
VLHALVVCVSPPSSSSSLPRPHSSIFGPSGGAPPTSRASQSQRSAMDRHASTHGTTARNGCRRMTPTSPSPRAVRVVTSTLPTSPVVRPFFIIYVLVLCTEPVSHPSEKGSGWNNVMQALLLAGHVAYLSGRTCVFSSFSRWPSRPLLPFLSLSVVLFILWQ